VVDLTAYKSILSEVQAHNARLVAVSKTKSPELISELYSQGQRDFGENYVQELVAKQQELPGDINWHFIGHLQSNKVRSIVPFVSLVHGVDSNGLLNEIGKQASKKGKVTDVLLQVHIAREETKFGLSEMEIDQLVEGLLLQPVSNVRIRGLMGMASLSDDHDLVRAEFRFLRKLYEKVLQSTVGKPGFQFDVLSMGMTSDYKIALSEGSNMVRIGSAIFGSRN
jgi:pyridoxal phosphate enzyme (YggS family)